MEKRIGDLIFSEYEDYHSTYTHRVKFKVADFTTALQGSNYLHAAHDEEMRLRRRLQDYVKPHVTKEELESTFYYNEEENEMERGQRINSVLNSVRAPNRRILRGLREMFDRIEENISNLELNFEHMIPEKREDEEIELGVRRLGWARAEIDPVIEAFQNGVEEASPENLLDFLEEDETDYGCEVDSNGFEVESDDYSDDLYPGRWGLP